MRIVLATGNAGKLREMQGLLQEFDVVSQLDFTQETIEEIGLTYIENAILKARHACAASGLPALADDSGLEVDALGGRPGVHSARYAGNQATDGENRAKLLTEMHGVTQRRARFRCILVFIRDEMDPAPRIWEGTWEGEITQKPQGTHGFGYDPVFLLPKLGLTAAELGPAQKNARSHRGQALKQLRHHLKSYHPPVHLSQTA